MKIWTVANQKGGVGKTTTAVSLGGLLSARGLRTLIVDLDPHGSMTAYFGHDPDAIEPSAYTLFERAAGRGHTPLASIILRTRFPQLSLLPASTALVSLDRQFGAKDGMGLVIGRALRQWSGQFDHVIIDCPPTLGILMVNALACCQCIIVPVQTEFLALRGLERLLHTLKMIDRSRPLQSQRLVVPTMFDRRTRASLESLEWLRKNHTQLLWDGIVPVDTKFREASQAGTPLPLLHPSSRGSFAYADLLATLLGERRATPAGDLRMAG